MAGIFLNIECGFNIVASLTQSINTIDITGKDDFQLLLSNLKPNIIKPDENH